MTNKPNNRMGLQETNYKEYAQKLYSATAKFGINKEKTYLLLSLLIGNSDSSIKKELSRKRIPAKYIDPIRYILHADSIYIDYFAILLPFYRDQDGKESLIKMKLDALKQKKKQPYWNKWLRLYEMKLSKYSEKHIVLDYFKKEAENLHLPIQEAVQFIHTILCTKSNSIQKNYSHLFSKIDKRIQIYELVYRSLFYLSYYSWVRGLEQRTKLSANEVDLKEKLREISFSKVEKYIQDLQELVKNPSEEDSYLRKTVRLLDLYYSGNKSMSDYEGNFSALSNIAREAFLERSNSILKKMKPIPEDELLYRVWHKYYHFLYLQNLVGHEIPNRNYFEVPERTRIALESLEEIQKICRGNFNRIRIKCIYHKRYLEFIWSSIEAYLLEKETLFQFGETSLKTPNHNHFSYDEQFNKTVEWMIEQKKFIINTSDPAETVS